MVARLRDVGFSLYEARLYVALLRDGAQNGNEVAKNANVPSSKVYTALDKLAGEGIVLSSKRGGSTLYTAVPPEELIARLRRQYNDPLDFLADELPKISTSEPAEPFLTVTGETAVVQAAQAIIDSSSEDLHISCWEEELGALRGALEAAAARGVKVFGMLYGETEELPAGSWMRHHYEDIVGDRVSGRLLALVADRNEALIARIPRRGAPTAVRSGNAVMTLIVQEYLHHDTVLQKAQLNMGFDEWDRWWQADPGLRAEIFGDAMSGHARSVSS
jgi:sugar-specific transcriptional regulator TrmB